MTDQVFGSPNNISVAYFSEAREILFRTRDLQSEEVPPKISCVVALCLAAVEAFMNSYFHILAKEKNIELLLTETSLNGPRQSLESKINKWPTLAFGNELNKETAIYKKFSDTKELRNRLFHFRGGDQEFMLDNNTKILGLHDISFYKKLQVQDGATAITSCENFIGYICQINGYDSNAAIQLWTGNIRTP